MRSKAYQAISRTRREAILKYWIKYFDLLGIHARFLIDGPTTLQ